ncbi:MAG TPA: glycosyltransferase [Bacteroides sp.]|mgnify:CR=1 FL=1|nr:glycosyltransferase [Bacteroides sp.]
MSAAAAVILFFILFYAVTILVLSIGLKRLEGPADPQPEKPIPVTLIIPFRNEAEHLENLVNDLSAQHYPREQLEVLFVDDHSDDGSGEKLQKLLEGRAGFWLLKLQEGKSGKKDAIFTAIQQASASWIIQTDADCRLGPEFIASHVAFLGEYPSDMVAGLVTTPEGPGGFKETFERLDLLSLVGTGAGSFHYRRPVMCSGANLGYSRQLYTETRRFDPSVTVASGDDMFLMIGARRLGKRLSFNPDRAAMVKTSPAPGLGSLIHQRVRWSSKTRHYGMKDIQLLAVVVTVTNLLVLSIPCWLIFFPSWWICLIPALAIKTLSDYFLLHTVTRLTGQRKALWFFLPAALFYYFYHLAILAALLCTGSGWKGRKY